MTERRQTLRTSRRGLLKRGAAAAVGIAAAPLGATAFAQAGAPAIQRGAVAGQRFRGFVRRGTTGTVEDLTLLSLQPRQVLVRTEAVVPCYTIVADALARR